MAKLYTRKSDGTYVPNNPQSVTNIDVVQTTGDSVTAAMSQDAVTKELATKQDALTAGNGISIEGNKIGVTAITESESQPDTSLWLNPSEDEETDVTYNRSQIDAMVGAKQDALQLTVKDNGNIVLSNIQGQSKEFMPATPSGDPMHYAYIAAGAEYNGTGADIVKDAPWADMIDDDYTGDYGKTVIHKAGYWYLNGLGDITNDEIRKIYQATSNFPTSNNLNAYFGWVDFRTNFKGVRPLSGWTTLTCTGIADGSNNFIILDLSSLKSVYITSMSKINKIKHILGEKFFFTSAQNLDIDSNLITARFNQLSKNIYIGKSSVLSVKSVLYMINNEKATSAITITLHADVYARAMANADVIAALEAHPNVSLASA